MTIEIRGDLSVNDVSIDEEFRRQSNGLILLKGEGNVINISTKRPCTQVRIDMGGQCSFDMGQNAFAANLHVHLRAKSRANFGQDSFAIGKISLLAHELASIDIGDGCLIGNEMKCMASDMHSIFDLETGARINPPGDIVLEDKIWLGANVTLLKGTHIGTGSIVGINSTVMGIFPANCMVLGYPARMVKRNVCWGVSLTNMSE